MIRKNSQEEEEEYDSTIKSTQQDYSTQFKQEDNDIQSVTSEVSYQPWSLQKFRNQPEKSNDSWIDQFKEHLRPGGLISSIFQLIVICLGAGTLSIPYVFYSNGVIYGTLLLILGALLSLYTGWLVVLCCHRLRAKRYVDIAFSTYGGRASFITSICMLACLLGFVVSYIVLFKELFPFTLEKLTGRKLPPIMGQGFGGKVFWSAIFSFLMIFPMSLPRKLGALRYTSFFSFITSIYIILAVIMICLFDRGVTPELGLSFQKAFLNFNISPTSFFNSMPLVIFSFMFQTNIPMICAELEHKDPKIMWKVLSYGTTGASIAYILAGIFGYVTFSTYANIDELMNIKNILLCYPDNWANYISLLGIQLVILFATPLTILPCKDTIEEFYMARGQKMNSKQNMQATFVLVLICFVLSISITNIGDAMTILGATTNSGIGFLLPIIFYLRTERRTYKWAPQMLIAYGVFGFISISSLVTLWLFVSEKLSS